jgi:hypothetical protein
MATALMDAHDDVTRTMMARDVRMHGMGTKLTLATRFPGSIVCLLFAVCCLLPPMEAATTTALAAISNVEKS